MSRTLERTSRLALAPRALFETITDGEFLAERHRATGAAWARVHDRRQADGRLVIDVEAAEYAHTMTGLDRSRTRLAHTIYEWDLEALAATWRWRGVGEEGRVRVSGALRIRPVAGEARASDLVSGFTVDARVPLLGGAIERLALAQIEKDLAATDDLLLRHAARRPRPRSAP